MLFFKKENSISCELLQVVTKIKVQEVQVDSQETVDSLRACERERQEYRVQLEESQSQHSQLSALLEQEQGLNEQLSDQVHNRDLGRLIGIVEISMSKLANVKNLLGAVLHLKSYLSNLTINFS